MWLGLIHKKVIINILPDLVIMHNLMEKVKNISSKAKVDLAGMKVDMVAIVEVEVISQVVYSQNNLLVKYVENMATQPLTVGIGMIGSFLVQLLVLCLPLHGQMPIFP